MEFKFSSNFLESDQLGSIKYNANAIVNIARQGNIPYIRIYDPLPPFPKFNIFGVDYPFNAIWGTFGVNLFNQIDISSILEEANKQFSRDDLDTLSLARIHWNGYSSYRGLWHRDGLCSENDGNDVICVLYLKKESGFKLIPYENDKLLTNFDYPNFESSLQPTVDQNEIDIDHLSHKVNAKAGDLFMFNSGLLHKGVVDGPRLHIHMRLTSKRNPSSYHLNDTYKKFSKINISSNLHPSDNLTKREIPIKINLLKRKNPKTIFIYVKRLITYLFPFPSKSFVKYHLIRGKYPNKPKYNIKGTFFNFLISLFIKS